MFTFSTPIFSRALLSYYLQNEILSHSIIEQLKLLLGLINYFNQSNPVTSKYITTVNKSIHVFI